MINVRAEKNWVFIDGENELFRVDGEGRLIRDGRLITSDHDVRVAILQIMEHISGRGSVESAGDSIYRHTVAQRNDAWRKNEELLRALHSISLASQSSMSSKEECGRIAREAIGELGPTP